MKKYLFSLAGLCAFLGPWLLSAQLAIVGVTQDSVTGNLSVVRWDAFTGVVLNSVPTSENSLVMSSSALDVSTGRYYFRGLGGLQEIGFLPPQVSSTGLQFDLGNAESDMLNGKLYGLSYVAITGSNGQITGGELKVVEYRLADSTEVAVYTVPQVTGYFADASAFDSNHGNYYFLGIDSTLGSCLYKVNLSGTSITHTATPMSGNPSSFYTLEFDNDYNTLYGLGVKEGPDGQITHFQVLQMDTLTAAVTVVEDLLNVKGYQAGTTTYDQANHALVFIGADSNFVFGLQAFDVANDTLYSLMMPGGMVQELEADNTQYAVARFQGTTSIGRELGGAVLSVWPQPASGWVTVAAPATAVRVELLDLNGRLVHGGELSSGGFSVADLPRGVYVLLARDRAGQLLATTRLLKQD